MNSAADGLGAVRDLLDQKIAPPRRKGQPNGRTCALVGGTGCIGALLGAAMTYVVLGNGPLDQPSEPTFGYEFQQLTRHIAFELGYSPVELRRQLIEAIGE